MNINLKEQYEPEIFENNTLRFKKNILHSDFLMEIDRKIEHDNYFCNDQNNYYLNYLNNNSIFDLYKLMHYYGSTSSQYIYKIHAFLDMDDNCCLFFLNIHTNMETELKIIHKLMEIVKLDASINVYFTRLVNNEELMLLVHDDNFVLNYNEIGILVKFPHKYKIISNTKSASKR